MPILLRCHKGIGPVVTGTALVAADNFSARYDLDRHKGVFSRPNHKLAGQSYVDCILVLDTAKGGSPPPGCCTRWPRVASCRGR
jgi:predicted aconitase with swiveling domain